MTRKAIMQKLPKTKTAIQILLTTHERLKKHSTYGDTMDSTISRCIDAYEKLIEMRIRRMEKLKKVDTD